MGTDIHMRAEVRLDETRPWEAVGSVFPNPSYDPIYAIEARAKRKEEGKPEPTHPTWREAPTTAEPYGGRNYTLFAALSDVRNGFGVAGVDTGDPIPPSVAAERGLPDDIARHLNEASWAEMQEYEESPFIFGEHSQGWITLAELLAYNWDYEVVHRGIVAAAEFRRCFESGFELEPRSACGGISGRGIAVISSDAAIEMIRAGQFPEAAPDDADSDVIEAFRERRPEGTISYHVKHEWSHPLREDVSDFLEMVDTLRHWGHDYKLWHKDGNGMRNPKATMHDPNCIRLVFGYDS